MMDNSIFDDYGDSDAFSPVAVPVSCPAAVLRQSIDTGCNILISTVQKPKAKPASKKVPAAKAPKAGTKKLVQTTLATSKTASKKRAKPESDEEDSPSDPEAFGQGSLLSNTPPSAKKQKKAPVKKSSGSQPLQGIENESMQLDEPLAKGASSKKSATEQYQRLTHLQHIIKRPDTYIGSVERTTESMWGW